jgi:hypothetical protein
VQDSFLIALSFPRLSTKTRIVNGNPILEVRMKKAVVITLTGILALSLMASADNVPSTQVTGILENRAALNLTDSQVKKLQIIEDSAREKMNYARLQADIRLAEIEKFTSNWTNMNGTAVRNLISEYYGFMTDYKTAELNAVVQARSILDFDQLTKYQQLVSIKTLMLDMEREVALR